MAFFVHCKCDRKVPENIKYHRSLDFIHVELNYKWAQILHEYKNRNIFALKKTKISSIDCVCNVHSFTYLILWSLMIFQRKNYTIQAFYSNYIMICIKKISCRWLAHRQNTHSMKKCIQRMLACARKNLFRCCFFLFALCLSVHWNQSSF